MGHYCDTGNMEEIFGPVIYAYTRQDALKDGVLIDVSTTAQEAGWRYPVAVTAHVWAAVVEPDPQSEADGESIQGRLWDVVWMASLAARKSIVGDDRVSFQVLATRARKKHLHTLIAKVGPGDYREPVVTIMFPEDD